MKPHYKDFYNKWAAAKTNDPDRNRILKWKATNLVNIFLRSSSENIQKLCEIGGAEGIVINTIGEILEAKNLDNYELSSEFCKIGQESFPNVNFINSEFSETIEEKYDAIILSDILEHVENDNELLQSVSKKTKYCIIKMPIEKCVINSDMYFLLIKGRRKPNNLKCGKDHTNGHLREYSINSAMRTVGKHFEIIDHEYTPILYFYGSPLACFLSKIIGKLPTIWIFGGALFINAKSKN